VVFDRDRSLCGWRDEVIGRLLPHLDEEVVNEVDATSTGVVLYAVAGSAEQRCPGCSMASGRVHSRYQRRLADLPLVGRVVELCLTVRRFFCVNGACKRRTFAEQVAALTRRRARRSEPLRAMLTSIGLALTGRAVARRHEGRDSGSDPLS
jgi:zinc-finger of transposase IS204/IS1001/IS1096/IS1165